MHESWAGFCLLEIERHFNLLAIYFIRFRYSLCFMHTDLGPVSLIYCRMAGGSGKDGSSKNKSTNKSSNKSINKNIAHNTGAEGGSSMPDLLIMTVLCQGN